MLSDYLCSMWSYLQSESVLSLAEIYSGLVGAASILSVTRSVLFFYVCVNAARILHNRMFGSVLRAPIRFFDTSPIGKR